MTPRTDVCETCENFRVLISTAVLEDEKLSLSEQFQSHVNLAQKEIIIIVSMSLYVHTSSLPLVVC